MSELSVKTEEVPIEKFRSEALQVVRDVFRPVAQTIGEVRSEVADRLNEVGARDWLEGLRGDLAPFVKDTKFGGLVDTALRGVQAGIDLVDGKLDASFSDIVI